MPRRNPKIVKTDLDALNRALDVSNWEDFEGWGIEDQLASEIDAESVVLSLTNSTMFVADRKQSGWTGPSKFQLKGKIVDVRAQVVYPDGRKQTVVTDVPWAATLDANRYRISGGPGRFSR